MAGEVGGAAEFGEVGRCQCCAGFFGVAGAGALPEGGEVIFWGFIYGHGRHVVVTTVGVEGKEGYG